ncbi:MAG: GGDEF domain-containing protein, partial [Vallitaleaceae bacterium]|nr:GGDEF domain-containing protein [Vallitaleaceae bacterium]
YQILQKYNMDLSKVPKDAILINKPISFYDQNKDILLPAMLILGVLLIILFIVIIDDRRQRALRIEIQTSHDEISALNEEMLATEEELRYQYDQLTESKLALEESEARYRKMALTDTLTGLKNRIAIMQTLEDFYQTNATEGFMYYIDIDNFKYINDSIGHTLGDELLKVIALRLQSIESECTQVARIGGDEFMILHWNLRSKEEATSFSYLYSQVIEEAIVLGANTFMLNCSMGIVQFPLQGTNSKEILIRADIAMHHAKDSGRNQAAFYDASMDKNIQQLIDLEKNIKKALFDHEFEMYYQPQLNLIDERIIGFEALIRWFSPEKGMIPPDHFIPHSEQIGLIHKIGLYVQDEILEFGKRLEQRKESFPILSENYRISFNASPIEISRPDYADSLIQAIRIAKIPPHFFALEITESTFLSQMEDNITKLSKLRDFGIEIHLDDFGTGYSSLTYLQKLPIHYVKLDRSFINDLVSDENQRNLSQTIILLAHNLGIKVIAEGVETQEQLDILKSLNCDVIQGYLLSKPLPEGTLHTFLTPRPL